MIKLFSILILALFLIVNTGFCPGPTSFKEAQLKYPRVREAYQEKEGQVRQLFAAKHLDITRSTIFLRAFKQDQLLEVWAKQSDQQVYQLLTTYKVCARSGGLGPKRFGGDYQTPEGFYYIDRFNPQSHYFLSLGINYPNAADRVLGVKNNLGGDIFIHGSCVTIGCLPLTDDLIKELYVMMVEARSNGQSQIPVHIFPTKLDDSSFENLKATYPEKQPLVNYWKNLKEGYDYFENTKKLPKVNILANGSYSFPSLLTNKSYATR